MTEEKGLHVWIKSGLALTLIVVMLALNGGETKQSIDFPYERLIFKEAQVNDVDILITVKDANFIKKDSDGQYAEHFYVIIINNSKSNTLIDEDKIAKRDILIAGGLDIANEKLYEVVDFEENLVYDDKSRTTPAIESYSRFYYKEVERFKVEPNTAKMYLLGFRTPAFEEGHYNITILGADLDPDISACGALSASGTYTLTSDVSSAGTYCFYTTGSNVILNLNGHTVDGTGSGTYGIIESGGDDNLIVENGTITGYDYGIRFHTGSSSGMQFRNLTIHDMDNAPVSLYNVQDVIFEDNTVYDGTWAALALGGTTDNITVTGNLFNATSSEAIYIDGSGVSDVLIQGNTFEDQGTQGVEILGANNINITENTFDRVAIRAIWVQDNENVSITYNNFTDCVNDAIATPESGSGYYQNNITVSHNIFTNVSVIGSGSQYPDAVDFENTNNSLISYNTINGSDANGINLEGASNNNLVFGNTIYNTVGCALLLYQISGTGNNLTDNNITDSDCGFSVWGGSNAYVAQNIVTGSNDSLNIGNSATGTILVNNSAYGVLDVFINTTGANSATWTNTTLGYNTTTGIIVFSSITSDSDTLAQNGTDFIVDPDFVSIDDTTIPELNVSATITIDTDGSCTELYIYKDTGLPTSKAEILAASPTGASAPTCTSGIATFNVTSFSGYALSGSDVDFTSPTPADSSDVTAYGLILNFTTTVGTLGATGNYIEIDGTNKTCTLSGDSQSCWYTLPYSEHFFGNTYDIVAWGNLTGGYHTDSRSFDYTGCGHVTASGVMTGSSSITGNTCFTMDGAYDIIGDNYTITGDDTASTYGVYFDSASDGSSVTDLNIVDFDNGIYITDSATITLDDVDISSSADTAIEINNSYGVNIDNCDITTSTGGGINLSSSSSGVVNNSAISNNAYGILIDDSPYTTISNTNINTNTGTGLDFVLDSHSGVMDNVTLYGNNIGIFFGNGSHTEILNNIYAYDNQYDFSTASSNIDYTLTYLLVDNPTGDGTNSTNISITDDVNSGTSYYINYTTSSTVPTGWRETVVDNATIEISPIIGSSSIDTLKWYYTDAEIVDIDETTLYIGRDTGAAWVAVGSILNTSDNSLTVTNLIPSSTYAIIGAYDLEYNLTYTVAYPENTSASMNFSCTQPYMNNSQPNFQDIHTPFVTLTNVNDSAIYNITLSLNDSLPSGLYVYGWMSGYRPPFTTQNWSRYGLGIVNIPISITNDTTTVLVPKIRVNDSVSIWFWADCVNVTDNQNHTYILQWGGGVT